MTAKKKWILVAALFAALLLALGMCLFGMNVQDASALTYTTPKYETYGKTTEGDTTTSGCPSNFTIYMHGSSSSGTGTMYNDKVIDWSYVYIKIEVSAMSAHESFKLTKDGYSFSSRTLSGNSNMTLYSGSLSSGEYELTYVGNYKANLFAGRKTFTYKYRFEVDKTSPSYTLKAGTSTISSGGYTNQQIMYTASDKNFYRINYRKPTSSSYSSYYSSSYTVAATESNNGRWYFFGEDDMGNTSSTVNVYLDTVKPVGKVTTTTGTTVSNGGYTNLPFKYTATDTGGVSKYEVKKAGTSTWTSYTSGTSVSGTNGWYYFRVTDKAGNVSDEYKVYYDATVPVGTLYGGTTSKSSGSYTNASYVKYVAADNHSGIANCYVKMPGSSTFTNYASGTQLATEGKYEFYCMDKSGNRSTTVSITLDKTKPTGTLYGGTSVKGDAAFTNASYIKYVATDSVSGISSCYVKKPGSTSYTSYTSGSQLTQEGTYYFYCADRAGNQSVTMSITLDRTAPTGTLYAGASSVGGGYTNAEYVKYVASDNLSGVSACYVKAPGETEYTSYTSGAQLTAEGVYSFYCVDRAGNQSATVAITLDRTRPVGTLYAGTAEKTSGTFTNASYIKYTASDAGAGIAGVYVKKPGGSAFESYTSGTQLTAEGRYEFYSRDLAGNQSDTVTITLDRTLPTGTLYGGTAVKSSGAYTNAEYVKYIAADSLSGVANCYVKAPGETEYTSYTSGAQLTAEGEYSFYCTDRSGNKSATVTIVLDKTNPVGTLYAGETAKGSGTFTNAEYVKYAASDSGSGVAGLYVKEPGGSEFENYTSDTQLTAEGAYSFYAVDRAGNQSETVTITLDKTNPTGTLYGGEDSLSSGAYTNAEYVKYIASDGLSGLANCYVKMPGSSSFTAYASGTQLATQGTYEFYCTDRSGNKSATVTITLDKTNPTGTLYGGESSVNSGDATNAAYIKFIAQDETALSGVFVKLPGGEEFVSYTSGTELTDEGTYEFYATDKASNQSQVYTITLDRKIPAAQLYVDGEAFGNNGYTNGEHIRFECAETCYVKQPGSETFEAYLPGTEFYKPGKYVFYGESEAGNRTGYFTITIDRTQKPLEVSGVADGKTDGDVILSWTDGDPEQFAPVVSVTVNGKAYTNGATIYTIDTGVYEIVCTDAAGNEWTARFTSSKQNVLTETLQKEYWEAPDAAGEFFSFATYESAFNFAAQREYGYVRTGEWNSETWDTGIAMDAKDSVNAANGKYFIYKKSGNPEELVAYFTEERLNEVIAEYAKIGIESYYYWEKAPATISDGENLYSYSDGKTILADAVQLGGNIGCLLDGEAFVGTVVETEGRHVLTVLDDWGNTCEYNLIIIRTAPEILYAAGEGNANAVTFDRTYYFKDAVTISIADAFDEMAMFNVYGEDGSLIGSYSLGETYTIEGSGVYTVEAVNHFGKSQVFSLIISRNAPEIEMTKNTEDKTLDVTISESLDAQSHIQTIEIYKSADGGETWVLLTADDYGTAISVENLVYRFRTSGLYRVVVTDEFRTGIDAIAESLSYTQAAPDGVLKGVENGGYTNGTVTFEWKDEATVTMKKDGKVIEYTSGKKLTEDGKYEITFENFDGYKTTYTFIIDTAAPEIVLSGAKDGETVNGDVCAAFEGEGVTAELFKDGKSLGAYVSGTVIAEDGAYKIVVTDLAQNKTEVEFSIDKTADYAININDKGLSNSVTVTANEEVTLVLTKNGEAVEYKLGDVITEPAAYTLTITDALGNKAEVSFTIVEPLVQKFEHNFDETPGFEKVLVNGEERRLNYGTLELFEDGTYDVGIVVSGKTYTFTVTVDGTAPTLKLDGVENGGTTTGDVILSELSETAKVIVQRGEEKIEYKLGETISEEGEYRVTVTDECGNATVYTFTIEAGTNWTLIVLLVVLGLLVAGGLVFFFIRRKKASEQDEA